ncbi:MAG TPA: DUF2171 domain-containing protein [Sphingomicrobium sp.]
MAYDRYDREHERDRRDERSESEWFGGRDRHDRPHRSHHDRDERGFFERAGEEISSWFGGGSDRDRHGRDDHREERGMWRGEREHGRDRGYDRERSQMSDRHRGSDRNFNENRGVFSRGGSSESDYNSSWRRNIWGGGERDDERRYRSQEEHGRGREQGRSREEREYRPMAGDYGRGSDHESRQFFAASGVGQRSFGGHDRGNDRDRDRERGFGDFRRESDRSEGPWSRDEYRRTSFAGSRKDDRDFDPNYRDWRERHMSEIDRDYHDYRREHQSRFENDFSGWRGKREEKRGLLGRIREHMEVVGSDGEHVGTVDKVAGDRIILTKSDRDAGGHHHSIGCSTIDRVEGERVILDCSARDARNRWRDEERGRALFERHEDRGGDGPHILERSFSGTYGERGREHGRDHDHDRERGRDRTRDRDR